MRISTDLANDYIRRARFLYRLMLTLSVRLWLNWWQDGWNEWRALVNVLLVKKQVYDDGEQVVFCNLWSELNGMMVRAAESRVMTMIASQTDCRRLNSSHDLQGRYIQEDIVSILFATQGLPRDEFSLSDSNLHEITIHDSDVHDDMIRSRCSQQQSSADVPECYEKTIKRHHKRTTEDLCVHSNNKKKSYM